MYTHVVAWNFKPEVKEEEKAKIKADAVEAFHTLIGKVPGLLSAEFKGNLIEGSTRDMCLVTTHEKAEDIAAYGAHPEHQAVANTFVRPYTCDRIAVNFE